MGFKCNNCGSTEIEVDNARGDAVCTNCGSVLEDNIIVSEVQFEESANGVANAVGQFVAADSKGGANDFRYGKFNVGIGVESREVTMRKARNGITLLCQQLSLSTHCIDMACNFFKMALTRQITRGRRNSHIYAACVYLTCRLEGTSHLLIDISDILQICCYQLGKTYLKISQALCINTPSIDPCIYIMRFANRLEFKEKTHEVSMTAQRLVQRMKKDSIHSGRRPTGLCGAALLIAARMHEFNRTINDILEIVRIHESTLKKRLFEFGQTPSSGLTLDEFMTIDLEAEQDPPAFLAARQRDKERLKKSTTTETVAEFTKLQKLIDEQLEKDLKGRLKNILPGVRINEKDIDDNDVNDMIDNESGLSADIVNEADAGAANAEEKELLPDTTAIYERPDVSIVHEQDPLESSLDVDPMDDIDDAEIDNYILQPEDVARKTDVWNKLNADYLEKAKLRQEKLSKEPEKKKRKVARKSQIPPSNTAGEAIAKMLQEKKISSKINYDVLKTLDQSAEEATTSKVESEESQIIDVDSKLLESSFLFSGSTSKKRTIEHTSSSKNRPLLTSGKRQKVEAGLQIGDYDTRSAVAEIDGNEIGTKQSEQKISAVESTDTDDYDDDEESVDEPTSIAKLMSKVSEDEEDYYD